MGLSSSLLPLIFLIILLTLDLTYRGGKIEKNFRPEHMVTFDFAKKLFIFFLLNNIGSILLFWVENQEYKSTFFRNFQIWGVIIEKS